MATDDDHHLGCIADAREEAEAARQHLLAEHRCVWGVSLVQPAAGQWDQWTLEVAIVPEATDRPAGWHAALADTQRAYGLTLRELTPRSPTEYRAILTL